MSEFLQFPSNFLWGVATSAHQIEGDNTLSDWWAWEHSPLRIKKLESKGAYPPDFQSGKAADHWVHWKEDSELIKGLNCNAYRCSVEWARLEPRDGEWDVNAAEHYRKEFKTLQDSGIRLVVTLNHFTLPLWAAQKGGWAHKDTVSRFVRFAEFAFGAFQEFTDYWVTLNEPVIYAAKSYLQGEWPPQKHNFFLFLTVLRNQIWAHRVIFQRLHAKDVYCQVGIAKNNQFFGAFHEGSKVDRAFALASGFLWNRWFLNKLGQKFDFLGLNYYFLNRVHFPFVSSIKEGFVSDLGWSIYPQGIEKVLLDLARFGRPILITENGVADREDHLRKEFIRGHLYYIHRAMQKGANVKGYFHWSLLDNFEWSEGFGPRFGLYEVDYNTFERKARPSALYYAQICKNNGIEI